MKHKANTLIDEVGAIYEVFAINGVKIKREYDISDCIVFSEIDNYSDKVPDDGRVIFSEIFGEDVIDLKRIKNVDYIKENSLVLLPLGPFGVAAVIVGYINQSGSWIGNVGLSSLISGGGSLHKIDTSLITNLSSIFEEDSTIVDFGCGNADYIKQLISEGFECEAYDGNPNTPEMTDGIGKVLDLSERFDLGKKFDYVISLEVAEHIPKEYEEIYVDNLIRHTGYYLITSWAVKGQGGDGHVNEQDEDYVLDLYKKKGMVYQKEISEALRSVATLGWFKETIYVFSKE